MRGALGSCGGRSRAAAAASGVARAGQKTPRVDLPSVAPQDGGAHSFSPAPAAATRAKEDRKALGRRLKPHGK